MCLCEQAHPCLESTLCQCRPRDGGRPFWMSPASAMDAVSLRSEPGDGVGLSWGWGCLVRAGEFCQTGTPPAPRSPSLCSRAPSGLKGAASGIKQIHRCPFPSLLLGPRDISQSWEAGRNVNSCLLGRVCLCLVKAGLSVPSI